MNESLSESARAAATADWDQSRRNRLRVSELFLSLQGEGTRVGLPTVFLRLTGCALRCRWCDTSWAFSGGEWRENQELEAAILAFGVPRLCLTGGEPLLQPAAVPLLTRLADQHRFDLCVETGGDQPIDLVPERISRILDIKLPGSEMEDRFDRANLQRLTRHDEVKFVVTSRADYERARRWISTELVDFSGAILLSPVHGELDGAQLAAWILEDRIPARLQLQQHKLLWPGMERGV